MYANYALLGFYLCYFGIIVYDQTSYQNLKKKCLIYNNGNPNENSRIRCA